MFCGNCGTQVNENAKFCPNCGAPIKVSKNETSSEEKVISQNEQIRPVSNQSKPKSNNKLIIAILAVVLLVAGYIVYDKKFKLERIDPFDSFILRIEGVNGAGHIYFDDNPYSEINALYESVELMEDQYEHMCKLTPMSKDCIKLAEKTYYLEAAFDYSDTEVIYPEGKRNGKLSNGDVVIYRIYINEDLLKKAGYKFKSLEKEYTIQGLLG